MAPFGTVNACSVIVKSKFILLGGLSREFLVTLLAEY